MGAPENYFPKIPIRPHLQIDAPRPGREARQCDPGKLEPKPPGKLELKTCPMPWVPVPSAKTKRRCAAQCDCHQGMKLMNSSLAKSNHAHTKPCDSPQEGRIKQQLAPRTHVLVTDHPQSCVAKFAGWETSDLPETLPRDQTHWPTTHGGISIEGNLVTTKLHRIFAAFFAGPAGPKPKTCRRSRIGMRRQTPPTFAVAVFAASHRPSMLGICVLQLARRLRYGQPRKLWHGAML